jgi:hypothetical protein
MNYVFGDPSRFSDLELGLESTGVPWIELGADWGLNQLDPLVLTPGNLIFTEDSQIVMVKMTWLSSGDACKI